MKLTDKQLGTVLAALRHWQDTANPAAYCWYFEDQPAMTNDEIDEFCEALNCNEAYADVEWSIEDLQELQPDWSPTQCRLFYEQNQNRIRDALVSYGWGVMQSLM